MKKPLQQKSVFKGFIKNKVGAGYPILLYIFSINIYALFFSNNGIQNIQGALGESVAYHFLPSLAAILILIMMGFNAYRKWFSGLMVTLIIITWALVYFVYYVDTESEKLRQEFNLENYKS